MYIYKKYSQNFQRHVWFNQSHMTAVKLGPISGQPVCNTIYYVVIVMFQFVSNYTSTVCKLH